MEEESQRRVADFYVGQARWTSGPAGVAPGGRFASDPVELTDVVAEVEGVSGGRVEPRVEGTALLSRRPLLQAVVFGEDHFVAAGPGFAGDSEAYLVGILVGLELGDSPASQRLQPYLVAGRLPVPGDGASMEVLLSVRQLVRTLDAEERQNLAASGPEVFLGMRVEVTAAHLAASGSDVLRLPARVVGFYDSGLDALDDATVVVPIEDARRLMAQDPAGGFANVLTVHGSARHPTAWANDRGWTVEGPKQFAQRYAGQFLDVLQWATVVLTVALSMIPAGLLWLGLAQQLERNRREIAVCRAIGVPVRSLVVSMGRLAGRVLVGGALVGAVLLALLAVVVAVAPQWLHAPVPVGFSLPIGAQVLVLGVIAFAGLAAVTGAWFGARRMDLAAVLRAL